MRDIKVLDCTLRDGGCVNDFNFGNYYMHSILHGLEASGVDIIECGYIDEKRGSEAERTQYINERVITRHFLTQKCDNITYVAMIDYGKFDFDNLTPRESTSIDGIRIAFHKKDRYSMLEAGRKVLDKGYKLFIQPMTALRYTDSELIDFIGLVNDKLPDAEAFYIVDSFGEMRPNDLNRMAYLVDNNLKPGMTLGYHSHNNLQLSYSNANSLLTFPTVRDLIIDSSVMGMGKGAGNLNTELLVEHLNVFYEKGYDSKPLLEIMDTVLNQIREKFTWGYSIEYYLSAVNHCTPSYSSFFYKKHMLSIEQVGELLSLIPEDKKISFDASFAKKLYYEYQADTYNDMEDIKYLSEMIKNKEILILGPGKSIQKYFSIIKTHKDKENCLSISLNHVSPIETNYVLYTKSPILDMECDIKQKIIMTSNVCRYDRKGQVVLNYKKWIEYGGGGVAETALSIILNVLFELGVRKVWLAGCDGFSGNIDDNYFDIKFTRPVSGSQASMRNKAIGEYLNYMKNKMKIEFLTPSVYQQYLI